MAVELYVTVYSSTSNVFVSPDRRASTADVIIHATSSPMSIHIKKICDDVIAIDDAFTGASSFKLPPTEAAKIIVL